MHLFVLVLTFALIIPNSAFAQDRNVNRYTPPPMFGGAEQDEASALPETRPSNNLGLINLDTITGRTYDKPAPTETNKAKPSAPAKALKPPLPPRRPATFQVSQDYLARITAPPLTAPARPRRLAPVISPTALAGDELNADLLAMDVMDIYENLNGTAPSKKNFINIPSVRNDKSGNNDFQLAFTSNSTTLTEAHAIKIDKILLPSLKTGNARIAIEAPASHNADKQQRRIALSRAIAIRNYLELNGIDRSKITINQIRRDTALSGNNTIALKLSE